MICILTKLKGSDNSGIRELQCIGFLGSSKVKRLKIGSIVKAVIKKIDLRERKILKGSVVRALIIRTAFCFFRGVGIWIRFNINSAIVVNKRYAPKGKRIIGPMLKEICLKYNFLGTITKFIV